MIQLIVGKKGSGKTKRLIELVNNAVEAEKGSVICIEKGSKLTYDINHGARLVDFTAYPIHGFSEFFGFICGSYSQNFDIAHIFVDSLFKVVGAEDAEHFTRFMEHIEHFCELENISFTATISADISELPEIAKKYILE